MPRKQLRLPLHHEPALRVPVGGAMCSNCRFYVASGGHYGSCGEPNFTAFYGSPLLPCPPDRFCSDWYVPAVRQPAC